MSLLMLVTLWLTHGYSSSAEETKKVFEDFVRQIYVVDVGQVKMEYKYTGEPVSRPAGLSFWIKCKNAKTWTPVGKFQMCDLSDYNYDAKTKKFTIKYVDGRVVMPTGEVVCDRLGEGEIDAKTLCK